MDEADAFSLRTKAVNAVFPFLKKTFNLDRCDLKIGYMLDHCYADFNCNFAFPLYSLTFISMQYSQTNFQTWDS